MVSALLTHNSVGSGEESRARTPVPSSRWDRKGLVGRLVSLRRADVVVVQFGEKYRQWNAAFDAGYAAALGKPIIVLHPPDFTHALKEIDAAALAVAETPQQVVEILTYVATQD